MDILKTIIESTPKEILEANVINFVIMLVLFAIICKIIKLGSKLQNAIDKVKETIDNSTSAKEKSIQELQKAEDIVSNIPNEIKEIEDLGDKNISLIEEKITQESEKQVQTIKENTQKIILNKEFEIKSNLSKKTVLASIELAKKHIINLLKEKPEYHEQFIQKSIQELDGIK